MLTKGCYVASSPCHPVTRSGCHKRRSGAIVIWLPFVLLASLAIIALAINYTRLWTIRVEMQSAADAAALAGADTLVGDDLLRGNSSAFPGLLQSASAQAIQYAVNNIVQGQPFVLLPNPNNLADGDIVFGTLDQPRGSTFVVAANVNDPTNTALAAVNAVQINAWLTRARGNAPSLLLGGLLGVGAVDIHAAAAAMLDRDVIGFRPLGQQPLKLAPLAVFSDPSGMDSKSWQYQIEQKNAPDNYRYDATTHLFVLDPAGDGLPEMPVVMATDPGQESKANVSLLYLGFSDASGIGQQLVMGVTPDELVPFGGQLVLEPADNRLTVPGSDIGPPAGSQELTSIENALDQLQQSGEARIWLLYCGLDGNGRPVLCGFVAARVVTVNAPAGGTFTFSLQPTMISTATAVTDASRRGVGGIAVVNPYICKVRLVE
jgi:Putative Flp pilus-assembly TadE/G-like